MSISYKKLLQPTFLICVAVLALAGGTKKVVIEKGIIYFTKLPLPLRDSLDNLDMAKMLPYKVDKLNKRKIPKNIEEELGTEQYIQWIIEDTEVEKSSPVRFCSLFITYYTGNPDQVPHIPDVCYSGSGNELRSSEELELVVSKDSSDADSVETELDFPVRRLNFRQSGQNSWDIPNDFTVLYFFKVNGQFAYTRGGVRIIMSKNLLGKYSYFSKVEWRFFSMSGGSSNKASEEDILTASNKLLSKLLPVLESDHWPDWDKANSEKATNENNQNSDNNSSISD